MTQINEGPELFLELPSHSPPPFLQGFTQARTGSIFQTFGARGPPSSLEAGQENMGFDSIAAAQAALMEGLIKSGLVRPLVSVRRRF